MENKKPQKKKNIGLFFFGMLIVFVAIFIIEQIGISVLYQSFNYLKYGSDVIAEAIWAGLVLIVLLLFKNSYVFTQENEDFLKGFKYGWPELVMSGVFMVISILSIVTAKTISIPTILNLALYCFFIGVVEEFMCRGWLFNEFLERYSDTRKGKVLSVVLSSLIFGLIHFINVGSAQGLAETIVQVMNATVGGIFLTLVYYKTKNIWTVITLHAIWDFSLMLGDSQKLVDCVAGESTLSIYLFNLVQGILLVGAYVLLIYWLFRQTDLTTEKKALPKKLQIGLPVAGIIIYLGALIFVSSPDIEGYYICPDYSSKYLGDNVSVQEYYYSEYNLEHVVTFNSDESEVVSTAPATKVYNFVLYSDGKTGKVILKNKYTEEKITLTKSEPYDYLLIDNEETFSILIQTEYNRVQYITIRKDAINDGEEFLKEVKNNLKEYVLPEIESIGTIKKADENHYYPMIRSTIKDRFYFNEKDELLFDHEDNKKED